MKKVEDEIFDRLKAGKYSNPPVNYLVIFLFACHGFIKEGTQHILLNEYDSRKGYYSLYGAEKKIRTFAGMFPNGYFVGMFAPTRNK